MSEGYEIDGKQLVLIVKRQFFLIAVTALIFLSLGVAYIVIAPPKYTAQTLLFLDKRTNDKAEENTSSASSGGFDTAAVASEVQVITSGRVTERVIKSLEEKEYNLRDKTAHHGEVIDKLLRDLQVSRVGETWVLSIRFTATDPKMAADVANAYAESYIQDQLEALSSQTSRTATWLQGKVDDLRKQAINSAMAVSSYREAYNSRAESGGETFSSADNKPQPSLIELSTLEKEAETFKNLHDQYLEKYKIASTQESFPISETRVITRALVPENKSQPKTIMVIGVAGILGLGIGLLLGLIRDNFDKTIRRAGQVKSELGLNFLGFMPNVKTKNRMIWELKKDSQNALVDVGLDLHKNTDSFDTIRIIKNSVDQKLAPNDTKIIGIVSMFGSSDDETIAANLAYYISTGSRTLVINTNAPSTKKEQGFQWASLAEIISKDISIDDMVASNPEKTLSYLGLGASSHEIATSINAKEMRTFLEKLKSFYEYIVVVLPPLVSKADVHLYSTSIDALVVLADWSKTVPNALNFYLDQNNIQDKNVAGVVLTNTDLDAMEKYYGHRRHYKL